MLRHTFDPRSYVGKFKDKFVTSWNKDIDSLTSRKEIQGTLDALFDHYTSIAVMKTQLYQIISRFDGVNETAITASAIHDVIEKRFLNLDDKVEILCDLSILELSLVVAIKHHSEIYDRDPFNFEIVFSRLCKFQNSSGSSVEHYDRAVVLKGFDVLKVI